MAQSAPQDDVPFVLPSDRQQAAPPVDDVPFTLPSERGQPAQATLGTMAQSAGVGMNKAIAGTLGAPVDLAAWGMRHLGVPVGDEPFGGSESIKRGMGFIGTNPNDFPARNMGERLAQGAGEMAAASVLPEGMLGGAARLGAGAAAPRTMEALQGAFGSAKSLPSTLTNMGVGAAGGAAGATAEEFVPDRYKPLAGLAGNILGGGAAAAGAEAPAIAGAGYRAAKDYMLPAMGRSGQEAFAGKTLRDAATNPSDVLATENRQIIPGSHGTAYQVFGDPGVGGLERAVAAGSQDFRTRAAEQNKAQVAQLQGIQPEGSPEALAGALRGRLNQLDQLADQYVGMRTQAAQEAAGGLGGNQSPEFYGSQIAGQITPQLNAARSEAAGQVSALGGQGRPEDYGAAMRGTADAGELQAVAHRRALYQAVDPDNSLNLVAAPAKDAASQMAAGIDPLAKQPSGEEASILHDMQNMPDVAKFSSMQALDSRITAAMATERRTAGKSPVWGRLSQLKSAVQGLIDNGVANQVGWERQEVARGAMAPADTVEGRLGQWVDIASQRTTALAGSGEGVSAGARVRAPGNGGLPGAASKAGSGPRSPAGAQGLSPGELESLIHQNAVPAEEGHRVVPIDVAKTEALLKQTNPDYHIGQDARVDQAKDLIQNRTSEPFQAPRLGVNDQGLGFDDGRHRFAAMRDLGFKTAPVSMDPESIANARKLGLIGETPKPGEAAPGQLEPNMTEGAAERLAAAKESHAALTQTFRRGPIGKMLKTEGFAGQYKITDAGVPDLVFHKGAPGEEMVNAYRKAVGNDAEANAALHNYAAMTLRRDAMKPDGTLDPAKFVQWEKAYDPALRAVPGLRQQFRTVANASEALKRFEPFKEDLAPSAIPEMFFHAGPSGGEGVRDLKRLVGPQRAEATLSDYAAAKLRSYAGGTPDETLNPKRVDTFLKIHDEALKELPGLASKFSNAGSASKAVGDAAVMRREVTDHFQEGAVGKILKVSEPQDVVNTLGTILGGNDAVGQMGLLADRAAHDPDAVQGLRKGIMTLMEQRLMSTAEAGTTETKAFKANQFQTFVKLKEAALRKALTPEQVETLKLIAEDQVRNNRSNTNKLPGSNTVQDFVARQKAGLDHKPSASLITEAGIGAGAGMVAHGVVGAAIGAISGAGKHLISGLRDAGIRKADELVRDALLDPDLYKALVRKAPSNVKPVRNVTLEQRLKRLSVFGAVNAFAGR